MIIENAAEKYGIEGVTYLGGEPTLQTHLPSLSLCIKKMGLGLIAFTGRQFEDVKDILLYCDLVIDGPYLSSHQDRNRRIIGSRNQRIIHLTERYKDCNWFENSTQSYGEFSIHDGGIIYYGSHVISNFVSPEPETKGYRIDTRSKTDLQAESIS